MHLDTFDYGVVGLQVRYRWRGKAIEVLRRAHLGFNRGEVTALLGESGSGKSTLARALLGILPRDTHVTWERIQLPQRIGFIQQEAAATIHPLRRVGLQITDLLSTHAEATDARRSALRLFEEVGLTPAERYFDAYAHQLSGGELQRVACVRAIAGGTELLIADEPTSQLDLIAQADVMRVLYRMVRERAMSLLLITHELRLVAELTTWVGVLYRGGVVDFGRVTEVWEAPRHAYTRSLLARFRHAAHDSDVATGGEG